MNISISHCSFSRNKGNDGHGGVIYVNSGSNFINIFYTMFYNGTSINSEGVIFYISSNSVLRMLCTFRCSAISEHFGNLKATHNNQLDYFISFILFTYYNRGSNWFSES